MSQPSPTPLNAEAWERRYQEGNTGWDLGQPAPAFVHWLGSNQAPPPGKAVVLGAGRGHDALLFASHGFGVTAVDFAPSPLAALAHRAKSLGLDVQTLQQDIFDLVPEHQGQFDYVIEHTCFCALDPSQRDAYVDLVADLLTPDGELLAIFFTHSRPGGPPFGSTPEELRQRFSPRFEVLTLQSIPHSVPARQGEEHLARFRRRGSASIM
jgi:SAM-dependent methyltransferase